MTNKHSTTVQSVDRALTILDILKTIPRGLGVTELSKELGVSKSTAHRLLISLLQKGLVRKNEETDKYQLGFKLVELGQVASDSLNIRNEASKYLHQLANLTGETAHLGIIDANEIVYIDKIESSATIRMYSRIGKRAPVHCTGVGKAILAYYFNDKIKEILGETGLKMYTPHTITSMEEMMIHLEEIRENGYSIDREEHEEGITCVAAPILNYKNEAVAAISVAGPVMRIDDNKLHTMAKEVVKATQNISQIMKGNPI